MMSPRPHHVREQELEDDASGETARRYEEEQTIEATLRAPREDRAWVDADDDRQDETTRWDGREEVLAWA